MIHVYLVNAFHFTFILLFLEMMLYGCFILKDFRKMPKTSSRQSFQCSDSAVRVVTIQDGLMHTVPTNTHSDGFPGLAWQRPLAFPCLPVSCSLAPPPCGKQGNRAEQMQINSLCYVETSTKIF